MFKQVSNTKLLEYIDKTIKCLRITGSISLVIFIVLSIPSVVQDMPRWLLVTLPIIAFIVDIFEWMVFVWLVTRKNIHSKDWKCLENKCVREYKNNPDIKQKHLQKIVIVCLITHTISLLTSTGTLIALVCNHNPFDYISFWPSLSLAATIIGYIFNIRFKELIKILEKDIKK